MAEAEPHRRRPYLRPSKCTLRQSEPEEPGEARTPRKPVRVISWAFIRLRQSSGGGGCLPEETKSGPAEAAGLLMRRDEGSELLRGADQPPHPAAASARGGARAGSEKAGSTTGSRAGSGTGSDTVGRTSEEASCVIGDRASGGTGSVGSSRAGGEIDYAASSRAGGGTDSVGSSGAREEIDYAAGSRAGGGTDSVGSSGAREEIDYAAGSRAGGGAGCAVSRRASRISGSRASEGTGRFVSSSGQGVGEDGAPGLPAGDCANSRGYPKEGPPH
ncbi:keratin, type I cytoskeletal 9-like [Alligator sinensis]|uniref:Keratin, type I cytoskeletal 9-like n=1 Tax=Alligator sinensis TaxID=38654 RepID=A0A3Q0FJJ5_ALLSI|nr:keratin, type I cytoskeletal 9-like [Alligator sinensis]